MMIVTTRLDLLLAVAWLSGTLPILIASLPSSRLAYFHNLLLGFAKRGKIVQPSSNFTVPQRFFLHFYVLGVTWTTFLLVITWNFANKMSFLSSSEPSDFSAAVSHLTGGSSIGFLHKFRFSTVENRYRIWVSVFLLLLMEVHVLRRLYETIYVFKYSPSARMHIFGYLTGLFFYTAMPLSLCHFCALEAVNFAADQVLELNVISQEIVSILDLNWQGYVKPIGKFGLCQWLGAAIFAWGWLHQLHCHAILGSLRESREHTDKYAIPRGDWFEIVSSPHYLAEMVIYAGLLVASGGTDLTIWLLLLFVVANLGFAAAETHRWYRHKFEDYPHNRRAILPYIY